MLNSKIRTGFWTLLTLIVTMRPLGAQTNAPDYADDYIGQPAKIDRYLDVEVWPDHSDGEYYEGDNVVIRFRSSADAFVAIYSIDTKGRVNLLFPSSREDDNYVRGGVTYDIPGGDDDYDLVVSGPEGSESIQIIASREKFPIPAWYHNSGLVFSGDDREEYMDYLNAKHFIRYGGQRFAFDRAFLFVNEWEDYYYRPVYSPYYPSWSIYGNAYIDYGYGSSVYINGIYYGVSPLYIPRLLVGWHYITIYDHYGYAWESGFHVSYYNTVRFDHHHIHTSNHTVSRFKEVRRSGYRDPVSNGYPNFKKRKVVKSAGVVGGNLNAGTSRTVSSGTFKYARGSSKMVKSARGFETVSTAKSRSGSFSNSESGKRFRRSREGTEIGRPMNKGVLSARKKSSDSYHTRTSRESHRVETSDRAGSRKQGRSSDYYEKRSSKSSTRAVDRKAKSRRGAVVKQSTSTRKASRSNKAKAAEKRGSSKKGSVQKVGSKGKSSSGKSGRKGSYKKSGGSKKSPGRASGRSSGRSKSGGRVSGRSSGRSSSGGRVRSGGSRSGHSSGSRGGSRKGGRPRN